MKWINASEQLPSKYGRYLVCFLDTSEDKDNPHRYEFSVLYWCKGDPTYKNSRFEDCVNDYWNTKFYSNSSEELYWMELPKGPDE